VKTPLVVLLVALGGAVYAATDAPTPRFVDIARQAGVIFHHTNGASKEKHLAETMGAGGLFFDFDGDGWQDIFLVDSGSVMDPAVDRRARHRLFRNRGDGTFADVSDRSGIRHTAYGMGTCSGDYDGDGRPDLYITSYGSNALYRNVGDGTFTDVTASANVGGGRWGASCAFGDLDRDGDLDLWIVNYVDAGRTKLPYCGDARTGLRFYCHPLKYDPLPSTVYRNDGSTFTDVSAASGVGRLRGNGLGVVIADDDADGWPDVFVANDTMPNFLFHNEGKWTFSETGLASGIALAADGKARAGMGIDAGDYDGDGQLDVVITNLDFEMHSVYRGLDRGLFDDVTTGSGVGFPTLPFVGFGVSFLDYDNDGRLDIAIATGHILDNAPKFRPGSTYAQRHLLFHNTTRRFVETGKSAGPGFNTLKVSRGLATADFDNDGDVDLLVTTNGQDAELLRNDGGNRAHALLVDVRSARPNTRAIGARIRVTAGGQTQMRDVRAGSSYLSQNELRAHFGLGAATSVKRLEVLWPSGRSETIPGVAADQIVVVQEGKGVVERVPFRK
jgi:hypothetical protein